MPDIHSLLSSHNSHSHFKHEPPQLSSQLAGRQISFRISSPRFGIIWQYPEAQFESLLSQNSSLQRLVPLSDSRQHEPSWHAWPPPHIAEPPSSTVPLQLLSLPSQTSGAPGLTAGSLSSQSVLSST